MVFGSGDPHAALMFVGEAPGGEEDLQGLPFVGRAGASPSFTENLSARAQRATLVTTPGPDPLRLDSAGAAFTKRYKAQFGTAPGTAGLYGYEAMLDILDAIRSSGASGNDRSSVLAKLNEPAVPAK